MTLTTVGTPTTDSAEAPSTPITSMPAAVAQRVFRAALEAMSRPGTIHQLPSVEALAGRSAAAGPILALADLMAPVAGMGTAASDVVAEIGRVTGAPVVELPAARLVLSLESDPDAIGELATGDAFAPQNGALVCQLVDAVGDGEPWLLTGPGVDGSIELRVAGLDPRFLEARARKVADFPAGIDVLLIDARGAIAALPRTTKVEVHS